MSDGPRSVYSLSFVSSEATRIGEGYQFSIDSSSIARVKPNRVSLGSIELPLSQMALEEPFCRVHLQERIRIMPEQREIRLLISYNTNSGMRCQEGVATFPLAANGVSIGVQTNDSVLMSCDEPHGLFDSKGVCLAPVAEQWMGRMDVVGQGGFSADVTRACEEGRLTYVDDRRLFMQLSASDPALAFEGTGDDGYLTFPSPPTISTLVAAVNTMWSASVSLPVQISYDPRTNVVTVALQQFPEDADEVTVSIGGDGLLRRLGITGGVSRTFRRYTREPGILPNDPKQTPELALITSNVGEVERDAVPLLMRGEPVAWPYIRLRPGHYAPSKKSFTPTPPQRIGSEFDAQTNRFFLRRLEDGRAPALVFVSPAGMAHIVEVVPGRYNADSLTTELTRSMNAAGNANYVVSFSGNAFTFTCVNAGFKGASTVFSLLLGHPRSEGMAVRLGFDEVTYDGSSSYTSTSVIVIPNASGWPLRNIYQLTEDMPRAKLRIVPIAAPPVIGVITSATGSLLTIDCYTGGREQSHGYIKGEIVTINSPQKTFEINSQTVEPADPGFVRGIVESVGLEPHIVNLRVNSGAWAGAVGKAVSLSTPLEPCSLNFHRSLQNTVGYRLGFDERAYEFGIDGNTQSNHGLIPPYIAPNTFDLDHPDFVNLYLLEGKRSSLTHHFVNGGVSLPFAKIVLHATYREERSLMREAVLSSGESMNRFVIELRNPDMTNYVLNGARFSFTLNFIVN